MHDLSQKQECLSVLMRENSLQFSVSSRSSFLKIDMMYALFSSLVCVCVWSNSMNMQKYVIDVWCICVERRLALMMHNIIWQKYEQLMKCRKVSEIDEIAVEFL